MIKKKNPAGYVAAKMIVDQLMLVKSRLTWQNSGRKMKWEGESTNYWAKVC